jgi:hypothetical protein
MLNKNAFLSLFFILFLIPSCSAMGKTQTPPLLEPTISPSQSILDYFPLKKGAYWVYQGNVKWTKDNSSDVVEEEMTWKMEVQRVFQRNNIVGYEMTGAPWDLAWYEAGKEPSQYGIIQVGGKFYQVPVDTVIRLMNEDDNLFGLVNESDILLDTPLVNGEKFCDTVDITRPDGMYCWNVGEGKPFDAKNVKGVDSSKVLWEYSIIEQTGPDVSLIYFVPSVGISRYMYHHFGTISDVDVQLVEYHSGD